MDSLLASYASSDDEAAEQQHLQQHRQNQDQPNISNLEKSSSIFSSLPPPKSSLFASLPPPKPHLPNPPLALAKTSSSNLNHRLEAHNVDQDEIRQPDSSADEPCAPARPLSLSSSLSKPKYSLFSLLPPPKSGSSSDPIISSIPSQSSGPKPKRVVQFRPPINPSFSKSSDFDDEDDEDDDKGKERKMGKDVESSPSVKQFLSSVLPAPRNSVTLGALPLSSGSGRRSVLEPDVLASNLRGFNTETEVNASSDVGNCEPPSSIDGSSLASLGAANGSSEYSAVSASSNWGSETVNSANYDSYGMYGSGSGGGDSSNWVSGSENYPNYDNYAGYGNYASYGHYDSHSMDSLTAAVTPDISGVAQSALRLGKRGRNDIPQEIVEVKQDELMKNRPREDQVKLTGIAFGPSYQPVSTKGKPSKLHKRKHQIGSLFFDMKQKEMELAERRSKGFLTKAETQAKYGW